MAHSLTPTEAKCMQYMAYGFCEWRIASQLKIAPKTVRNHLQRAYDKLGASDATRSGLKPCVVAIRRALKEGIVEFPPLADGREDTE